MSKAVILLSGGLDSVVSLALVRNIYSEILALTFDYSQKSVEKEIISSKKISEFYGIKQKIIKIDWLNDISTSALNKKINVPSLTEKDLKDDFKTKNSANSVWVPNRNALFINIAACYAEALKYDYIIIGANKEEGKTFIDNSKKFINSVNSTLRYSVNTKIKVDAPLINMTKKKIVEKGIELNIPFNLIYSCYNGTNKHCGFCESCCRLRTALKKLGKIDIINNIFG